MVFGLFGSVAHELHFCVCAGYRLLICYGPLPVFFFTASKLQFRHRVEGLRTHRFWLARARLVVAFGLFGSVASSFGTMWKGCERTVFGCLFSGLCFACLGHEACCRSRLSEASHRGILLGVGSNPAAVRAFRMGSFYFRLLHGIWRCGILVSDPASQRGCWPQEMFYGFQR